MKSTLFDFLFKPLAFIFLCLLLAVFQAFAFHGILTLDLLTLCLLSGADIAVFAGLCVLLSRAVKFGNYLALDLWQRIINYTALCILFIGIWIAAEYLIVYMFMGNDNLLMFNQFVSLKIFIALLLFLTVAQIIHSWKHESKISTEISEVEQDDSGTNIQNETIISSQSEAAFLERITVKKGPEIHMISIPEVVYFQAEGDYVRIFTDTDKFLKEETMKYFQTNLSTGHFVRVHRSYLVNIEKINRIELYEKQNHQLSMSNGNKIKISVSGYKKLRNALNL